MICIPFTWYSSALSLFTLYVLLAPVVYLLYFVKVYMKGNYSNDAENVELCRVVFLKLCIDSFMYNWITTSFAGLMIHVSRRYYIGNKVNLAVPSWESRLHSWRFQKLPP